MSNTYTTSDNVGTIEDVSKYITNLTPSKTPLLTAIGSGEKPTDREFKWQEDKLRKSRANAHKEAGPSVITARAPTLMRRNGVQIFKDTFSISGTMDAIKSHGRGVQTAYETIKVGKELKLDVENRYVSDGQYVERVSDTTEGYTAGAAAMISNKVTSTVVDGDAVMELSEKMATVGGTDANILMIRLGDAKDVAKITFAAQRTHEIGTSAMTKVVNDVTILVTPFHELRVVKNLEMNDYNHAFMLDTDMWADRVLRGWEREEMAKNSDATITEIRTERGLQHKNFAAGGLIEGLADLA